MKKICNSGFSLIEVLIAIGIIGVVAALTIPVINMQTHHKTTVEQLKKTQDVLDDAFGRVTSNSGILAEWGLLDTASFTSLIANTMKIVKNCAVSTDETCFNPQALTVDSLTSTINHDSNYGKVVLADGTAMAFTIFTTNGLDCSKNIAADNSVPALSRVCGYAVVDVDGPSRGRAMWGRDIFGFHITENGFYPFGLEIDATYRSKENCLQNFDGTIAGSGRGCAAWVLYNENLNYLNCGGASTTLTWTKTACP